MPEITEKRPELIASLDALNELNQRNEKVLIEISELCSRILPMKTPTPNGKDEKRDLPGGAVGDLQKLITVANWNHDSLCRIMDHLRLII